jgi:sortase B
MKNRLLKFVLVVIIGYSAFQIGVPLYQDYLQTKLQEETENLYDPEITDPDDDPLSEEEREALFLEQYLSKFGGLIQVNPDFVGWLNIPETKINFPVVKGTDNSYYLTHNFEKKRNANGAIFMDYRSEGKGNDLHTVIFGHNRKNGKMFQDLTLYKNRDYLNRNRYIYLDTYYGKIAYEIFSVYITDTKFYFIRNSFSSNAHYQMFLDQITQKSMFDLGIRVTEEDRILTLSTCTYEFKDARFVIHARRIAEPSSISPNSTSYPMI